MANSVGPDQTAPIGAVCSGSTLYASILGSSVMLGNYFAADDFSRRHFQMHFFLGALRVNRFISLHFSLFFLKKKHLCYLKYNVQNFLTFGIPHLINLHYYTIAQMITRCTLPVPSTLIVQSIARHRKSP